MMRRLAVTAARLRAQSASVPSLVMTMMHLPTAAAAATTVAIGGVIAAVAQAAAPLLAAANLKRAATAKRQAQLIHCPPHPLRRTQACLAGSSRSAVALRAVMPTRPMVQAVTAAAGLPARLLNAGECRPTKTQMAAPLRQVRGRLSVLVAAARQEAVTGKAPGGAAHCWV